MVLHKDVALGNMHPPYNYVYADATARLAATGFVPDDVGKLALQVDTATLWLLQDDSPETWSAMGEATAAGVEGDIQFNTGGALGASAVGLNWTEGVDETDSLLTVEGTIIGFSALIATNIGVPRVASAGDLNLVMIDELQINGDGGTSGQVLQSNGAGVPPTWETGTGGSGTPGGSDTELQYNDGGNFDGTTGLTWNGAVLDLDAGLTLTADPGSAGEVLTSGGVGTVPTWATPAAGFTAEDARDAIGTALVAGNNIDITVSDGSDTITIDVEALTSTDITDFNTAVDERARDAVGTALVAGGGIDVAVSDGSDTITVRAKTEYILHWVMDEGGVPALNQKAWIMVPWAHEIKTWWILANAAGSCTIDVWRDSYSNFPPTVGDSVVGTKPALSTAIKNTATSLAATWNEVGAAQDLYTINLENADTFTVLEFLMLVERTA